MLAFGNVQELAIVLVIALLVAVGSQLPRIVRARGEAQREQDAAAGDATDDRTDDGPSEPPESP
jgi:Sec-independent protein translocase protein TatA